MRLLSYNIMILLLCAVTVQAQESQKVMTFLKIPTSAHAAALGGDNVSIIEDDATLAMSNPSLLASVSSKSINLGYMNYMSGVNMFTAGYTHVLSEKATLGCSIEYLNYGTMKETDYNNQELGEFSASDLVIEPIFSYTLAKNFVGGIGAKFIYSNIASYSSTAAAVDLGINYFNPDWDFSASLVCKNLGGQLSAYNDEYESLPTDFLLGVSQGLGKLPFRVSLTFCDLGHWDYAFFHHLCLGLDITVIKEFYIAGGYNFRRAHDMTVSTGDGSETTGGAGWTVGGGLQLDRFSLLFTYGKYHVTSSSFFVNLAYRL